MSSDILLNLLLNPFFMCELKRKFLCMLLALGSVRMWKCHYPMQFSDLLSKTQPLYMRCFPYVTWLQRGAASRKPGIKIIAPALMTCDELEISWIFQPCASSCRADDLFGGSSDIVRYFNLLSFSLLAGGICDNEQCVIFIKGLFNYTSWKGGKLFSHIIHSNCSPIFLGQ